MHAHKVEIIGHRGASDDAPENTLAAIHRAWQQGADAVEVDVHLARDGHIVVIHDDNTARTTGLDRPVREQTLAELKRLDAGIHKGARWKNERIPTLAEAWRTIPPGKRMLVEIKCGPEILPPLQALIGQAPLQPEQVAFISFGLKTLAAVKAQLPAHETYWLCNLKWNAAHTAWEPTARELLAKCREAGFEGLDINAGDGITAALARAIRSAGMQLLVWTVNDPAEAERLRALGVDGITTNCPGRLRKKWH